MAVAPAKAGGLNIKELLSNLDVDGDGDIDENDKAIAEALKSMDMDGDGTISIRELIKIGEVRVRNEKRIKNLTYAVFALCGLFVVFCAVMMALVVAANEATKDTRPSGDGTMKTVDGKVVSTESKKYPLILADLPRYPFEVIESLDALRVRKTGTQETYYYTVTGYSWFSKYSMQLHTARHDIISINGAGEGKPVAVTVISGEADGASFSVEIAPEKTAAARRRLMQAQASTSTPASPDLAEKIVDDQGGNGATGALTAEADKTDTPATDSNADKANDKEPDKVKAEKWDTNYRMDMVFAYGTCILGAPDTVMGTEATAVYEGEVLEYFGALGEVAEGVTAAVGMKQTKAKIDAALASKSDGKRLFTKMQVDFVECCASIMPWPHPHGNVVPISKWPPVEKADTDNTEYKPADIASLYGACYTKYNDAAKAAGKPQIKVAECASKDANLYDATCKTIQIGGCMNKDAKNYNAAATFDDATCVMPKVGCKVKAALNYDATLDAKDKNDPAKCVMLIHGCMDAAATNFVPKANKDPLLKINDEEVDWKYEKNGDAGVIMTPTMAAIKAQYDTRKTTDSNNKPNSKPQVGSCTYKVKVWGCWDKMSKNYNDQATDMDYDMCEPWKEKVEGCIYKDGDKVTNYNENANFDNGLCTCKAGFTPSYDHEGVAQGWVEPKNAAEYNAQVYRSMEPKFECVAAEPPAAGAASAPAARHLLALKANAEACTENEHCLSDHCVPDSTGALMVCAGKANGEDCKSPANCASDYCSAGACGVKPTAVKANDGDACVASADCKSDMCSAAVCVAKPENKKDIGLPCKVSSDCKSDLCAGDVCKAKTADKKDDGLPCVAAADCKSDTCSQNVCVAKSTGSGMLAGVLSIPTTATITGDDGVGKAAELISSTVQMVNGAAEAAVEIVPCRSTVYFNVDMSGTLAKADYDAVMTAVTTAAESMMKEENTYVGVVTFRGPVTQTEFKSAADTDSDCTGAPTTDAAGTPATLGGSSSAKVPATTPATAPARRRLFASHDATTPAGTPTADDIAAGTDAANPLSMPFVKATSDLTEFKAQVGYGSYEKNIDGAGDAAQRNPSQSDVGAGLKMSASATEWYEEHDESPRKKYIITLLAQTPINLEKMKKQSTAAKTAGNFLMFYNMNMQTVTTPTLSNDLASKDAAGVRTHFVDDSEAPAKVNLDKLVKQFKANFKATRETVAGKKKYCTMAKTPDDA